MSFLLLLLFIPITLHGSGIKSVVVLKEGVNLTEQMIEEDAIYKLSTCYDLGGNELHVPKDCVLMFEGGSIVNGTIRFENTELCGYPQVRCNVKGSVPKADITWFGAERSNHIVDVGSIINQVQGITSHIIIPAGDFYQTDEAIRIEGNKYIEWIGNIVCASVKRQYDSFTIASGTVTLDMEGGLYCKSKNVDYTSGAQTELSGLVLENINNSRVNIGTIRGFNTGVKLFGYGGGCSYNLFSIKSVRDCNTGILITQRDKKGRIGWANENTFIGGRFGVSSSWNIQERETHAVVAMGIYSDDTYNKVNSLFFLRPCAEGNFVPFVFHNAEIITVEDCRTERGVIGAKLSGRTNRVHLSNSFGTSMSRVDLSEIVSSQSRPLFRQSESSELTKNISFNISDQNCGRRSNEGFLPLGQFSHLSYKGQPKQTVCPIANGDVSEIGTEVTFEKSQFPYKRSINITIPQNHSDTRRYVYLSIRETHDGSAGNVNDVLYSQSMTYNSQNGYWVSKADVNNLQIIFGENTKKVAIVFRNVSGFEISQPSDAL